MTTKLDEIRERAEGDLYYFIKLVAPQRVLGSIHEELIRWWERPGRKSHQLVLLPRAHQKSMLIAYRVAHWITKHPDTTILYLSSTTTLAEKQLKAIKDILSSKIYRRYWPEMVNEQEGKRELWNNTEIAVDHPKRKLEGVRDPTVWAAGLTSGITGMHCDVAVLDDVVVQENAYTQDGRRKVGSQYSLLSSIENPDAQEWVVGTRYESRDLYQSLIDMEMELYDESGDIIDNERVYEVFEEVVENVGDGTGEFLWPRQKRSDGRWYGFNTAVLAKKRAQYLDKKQFYAQYYNNPNDPGNQRVDHNHFQYYEREGLNYKFGKWYYFQDQLNVVAAIDFAFSRKKTADYTAVVVVGMDSDQNIFVLDIKRFRTDSISEYYNSIIEMHDKWKFRLLRAEISAGQKAIVNELYDQYIKPSGRRIVVDEYRPSRDEGTKEERISAVLEPRYENRMIWHYVGGNCQILEEELKMAHPPHDDCKDAFAAAVNLIKPPPAQRKEKKSTNVVQFHPRFGGVAH